MKEEREGKHFWKNVRNTANQGAGEWGQWGDEAKKIYIFFYLKTSYTVHIFKQCACIKLVI